ncbi:MAG: lysophospholipid acyltransferase family protein [Bacteroidales bacterium]
MKRVGIFFFRITSWIFSRIPLSVMYIIADFVYFLLFFVIGYRKKVVFKNLRNSFPEKTEEEIKKIATLFYHHLGDIFVENIALIQMKPEKVKKMIDFESCITASDIFNENKHIVLVTAHYNNWEFYLVLPLLSPHKTLGVYKPLNNKYYDKEFFTMRTKFGVLPVSMNDSFRTILTFDKNKEYVSLGLIADQRPPRSSSNYWTSFLNQDASIFLGPEKIAKKIKAPIIFTHLEKIKRGKYKMVFDKVIEDPSIFKEFEITETYVRWVEKLIQEKPEYYLWSHNRWKHKRNPQK